MIDLAQLSVEELKELKSGIESTISKIDEAINKGRRKCFKCKEKIGRHDKWIFRKDGRIEHRNCNNKEYYS